MVQDQLDGFLLLCLEFAHHHPYFTEQRFDVWLANLQIEFCA